MRKKWSTVALFFIDLLNKTKNVISYAKSTVIFPIIISIVIGSLLFILFENYETIKSRIIQYILNNEKLWRYTKLSLIIFFVFMLIYNFDNILTILKSKTAPDWFSAIGTISAVIVALLPHLKKSPNLLLNFSLDCTDIYTNTYTAKLEIRNLNNKSVSVIANTVFYFFNQNGYRKRPFTHVLPDSILYRDSFSLQVPGNDTITYYSNPTEINISKAPSNYNIDMFVCATYVSTNWISNQFITYNVYEIKNGEFILKGTFDRNDYESGKKVLKNVYHLDLSRYE